MVLENLLSGVEHEITRAAAADITAVTHDSRLVESGTLFVCLRGMTVDGHDFIAEAISRGAAAVVVDKDFDLSAMESGFVRTGEPHSCESGVAPPQAVGVAVVADTRQAMAIIAANFHSNPAKNLRLVGVTGTNGKTTTTFFIEEILRKCGRKTGLIGTVGLRALGEPLELPFATDTTPDPFELHSIFKKMLEMGVQDVVMEVSSHALALFKMEGLVFDVGVFTNLTQDHLDLHGTMENYAAAKARLFAQSDFAVVNADCEYTPVMLAAHGDAPFSTYAISAEADFRALHTDCRADGSSFQLAGENFEIPVSARFNVYNALAAIATARALGAEMPEIREAVATLRGVPGRIQAVPNARGLHVFIDYAHSPDGLENIIKSVRASTHGRVVTLFGCGGDRDKTKRPIMGEIAATLSDFCVLTSDNPRTENPHDILAQIEIGVQRTQTPYEIIENRRAAIFAAVKKITPDDALIIAGKGHEDYQILGTVKHHFDDFEVASEALEVLP